MIQLDPEMLAALSAFVVALVQAMRMALAHFKQQTVVESFGPFISIGFAVIVCWLMLTVPEGVNAARFIGYYALATGLMASGLFSAGKRMINGGK